MKRIPALLLIAFLTAPLFAQIKTDTKTQSLVLKNVSIIDMTGAPLKKDMTVVVSGNRLTAIGSAGNVRVPRTAQVIDARGKFLIPGLWDMHVHLFNNVSGSGTNNKEVYFSLFIANGVTGVRDMFTDADDIKLVREWQSELEAGRLTGPRIAPGSAIVDGVPTFLPNLFGVATPEEGRAAVRKLKADGAGFIKVYWNLKPDVYRAIADEAKKLGIAVAGHVPFSMSAAEVSDAGQKSIEHLTGILETCSSKEVELRAAKMSPPALAEELWKTYDENKCRELFRRFAKNRTWQTPTAVLHRANVLSDEDFIRKDERLKYIAPKDRQDWVQRAGQTRKLALLTRRQRFEKMLSTIRTMYQNGVPMLTGTDVGNPFVIAGFSLHDELELFVQGGLSPLQALETATVNPAKYLGWQNKFGTIEKGKIADLVLLDANPLEEIGNTRKIFAVILNGKYLPKEDLQQMLADVEKSFNK
jgi:imidazolonepropionase-like amidohydrolase